MQKPTILFVPGALTALSCYDYIVPLLQKQGYSTVQTPLPSNNPKDPSAHTAETDGRALLQEALLPLLGEGRDVVVFAHSFGATAMSGAKSSVTKAEREARGESGGVVGVIYISCCLVPDGQDQITYLGGALPDCVKVDTPSPGLFVFDPIIPFLFNDAEPAAAEECAKSHLPHAIQPLATPGPAPHWTDSALEGRRAYLKTTLDTLFPPEAQQMFIDNSQVAWNVVEVDGGHEAFITKPKLVADAVVRIVECWI
ncbi:hypothetical protein LTR53_000444 [Teratosphaeriaceae sp. CCFEE 6253]|nr:hypothetical protein LTR53_000444 [Teratosphaeriaceae sp. CCFEE 6253]